MAELQASLLAQGEPAVDAAVPWERADLGGGAWVDVARGWLRGGDALLALLVDTVPWQQGRRWMYDRMVDDPRLAHSYRRGGPVPHPVLTDAHRALERRYRVHLAGPVAQYYRDGRDSVAPHADRDLRHLDDTIVAVLTVGAQRPWVMRPARGGGARDLAPASGDLLVMGGRTQRDWVHGVPKVARAGPRISLTWRWSSRTGRPEMRPSWRSPRTYDRSG